MRQRDAGEQFVRELQGSLAERGYRRFDQFITQYLGYSAELPGRTRRAYLTFLHETKGEKVASLPTIRKWFGIHGFKAPTRRQVFRICLALKTGVKMAEAFLMEGIGDPSFQAADYEEMIGMYCLEHRLGCEKHSAMVREYEKAMEFQKEIRHESNTSWLLGQFEAVRKYAEQDFLHWMREHAALFKGYSVTAQEYLEICRSQVMDLRRQEMQAQLDLFLSETGYHTWRQQRKHTGKREDVLIRNYVKQHSVPEDIRNNILELVGLVYSESGQNSILLSELFCMNESAATIVKGRENAPAPKKIHFMTSKYLSDLFNIPLQNERMIWVRRALSLLGRMDGEASCPQSILGLIRQYGRSMPDIANAWMAQQWLSAYDREHRRRRRIVGRRDLLPLIHYISQQRYVRDNEKYDQEAARKQFRTMADAVMIACHMAPLDENCQYDMILMACFGKEEMHGYVDILEHI